MFNLPKYPLLQKGVEGTGSIPTTYEPRLKETENVEVPYKYWGVKNADSEPLVNGQQREKTSETKLLKEMTAQPTEAQPTSGLKTEKPDADLIAGSKRKQEELLEQAEKLIRENSEKKLVQLSYETLENIQRTDSENILEALNNTNLPEGLKVKITLKSQSDNPISLIPPGDNLKDQKDLPELMNTAIKILKQHDQERLSKIDSKDNNKKLDIIKQELKLTDYEIERGVTAGKGKSEQELDRLQARKYEITVNPLASTVKFSPLDENPATQLKESTSAQPLPEQAETTDMPVLDPSSHTFSEENAPEPDSNTDSTDKTVEPSNIHQGDSISTAAPEAPREDADQTSTPDPIPDHQELPPPADGQRMTSLVDTENAETSELTQAVEETIDSLLEHDADISPENIIVDIENNDDDVATETDHPSMADPANAQEKTAPMAQVVGNDRGSDHPAPAPPPPPLPPPPVQQVPPAQTITQSEKTAKKENRTPEGAPQKKKQAFLRDISTGNYKLKTVQQTSSTEEGRKATGGNSAPSHVSADDSVMERSQALMTQLSKKLATRKEKTIKEVVDMDEAAAQRRDQAAKRVENDSRPFLKELIKKAQARKSPDSATIDADTIGRKGREARQPVEESSQDSTSLSLQETLEKELKKIRQVTQDENDDPDEEDTTESDD